MLQQSNRSIDIAALTLAQEARGEPAVAQRAVAWVLRNRLETGRWGTSLMEVCLWTHQFSGWTFTQDPNFAYACNLQDNDPVFLGMRAIIVDTLAADGAHDPTKGATHYFNPKLVHPDWYKDMQPCGQFGQQTFCRAREKAPTAPVGSSAAVG